MAKPTLRFVYFPRHTFLPMKPLGTLHVLRLLMSPLLIRIPNEHLTIDVPTLIVLSPLLRRVYTMRQRHAMCVKIALCKQAYCDMRLSQESWMISTFLWQHATVACRTNKPVYTARFSCTSHVASVLSHRVNAPLFMTCYLISEEKNRYRYNIKLVWSLLGVVVLFHLWCCCMYCTCNYTRHNLCPSTHTVNLQI